MWGVRVKYKVGDLLLYNDKRPGVIYKIKELSFDTILYVLWNNGKKEALYQRKLEDYMAGSSIYKHYPVGKK
jgi:hypothetical protein